MNWTKKYKVGLNVLIDKKNSCYITKEKQIAEKLPKKAWKDTDQIVRVGFFKKNFSIALAGVA